MNNTCTIFFIRYDSMYPPWFDSVDYVALDKLSVIIVHKFTVTTNNKLKLVLVLLKHKNIHIDNIITELSL